MNFIDLFAGLGGFHKALSDLGHKCVFASEINDELKQLYFENWGIQPDGDIVEIVKKNISKIPEHDILCGGFPCQPFSQAGKRMGVEDKRGNLFNEIIQILQFRKPKFLLLENVPHLSTHDNKRTMNRMKKELNSLGYEIDMKIYSPIDFGIPQNRKRIFIVGCLKGLEHFSFDSVDVNKNPSIDLNKFISKTYPLSSKLSEKNIQALNVWQNFLNVIPGSQKMPGFPIWSMEFGANYPVDISPASLSNKDLEKFKGSFGVPLRNLTKSQQLNLLPNYSQNSNAFPAWKKRYIKYNREFYKTNKKEIDSVLPLIINLNFETLQKFEWNVGKEERIIKNYFIQFRPSGIRIKKSNFFPSLVCSSTQLPVIGWQNRYITNTEALKLQSLEGLQLPKNKTAALKSLGNAVNSKIVSYIFKSLLDTESKSKLIKSKLEIAI
jgi:DNA (cytosine-5)-methyltransferase 1